MFGINKNLVERKAWVYKQRRNHVTGGEKKNANYNN
jgi:hypothetical protein